MKDRKIEKVNPVEVKEIKEEIPFVGYPECMKMYGKTKCNGCEKAITKQNFIRHLRRYKHCAAVYPNFIDGKLIKKKKKDLKKPLECTKIHEKVSEHIDGMVNCKGCNKAITKNNFVRHLQRFKGCAAVYFNFVDGKLIKEKKETKPKEKEIKPKAKETKPKKKN